ncbi:uncharacterized protein LOC135467293 [Liolophura sinensis]|uniref:uncharacterized protein LOC135467293 n=1 Tax=Liolophura sinensis TaxID=3198878 RepID=UPI003159042C
MAALLSSKAVRNELSYRAQNLHGKLPLGIPSGQYLGFLAYFNRVSNCGVVGRNELRAILERAGRDPTEGEIQRILDSVSVDPRGINFQAFIDYVRTFQQLRNVDSEYREAFRIYDRTGSGKLTQEDVAYVFEKLRVNVDVPALFKVADADNNGTIEYNGYLAYFNRYSVDGYIGPNELTAILERAGRDPSDQEVRDIISHVSTDDSEFREAFRLYDRRGLGRLYKEDLEYVFQKLRVSIDVDALFKAVDLDSSGTIEYNEFVEAMKKAVWIGL